MKLIKHIDFTTMNALDLNMWTIATGDKWANNELQIYTDRQENLFFDQGLVIRATKKNGKYYSARIHTKGKFSFQYGRIDITAKVPGGLGTWPALWMMSKDNRYGHWPRSGEIDIMEHVGRDNDHVFLCLHSESYNHTRKEQRYKRVKLHLATDLFHTYSLDWKEQEITYMIDGEVIHTYRKDDLEDTSTKGWPFDHPYYLLMNMAIGGKFGGPVDDEMFPRDFIIKEIKISQRD